MLEQSVRHNLQGHATFVWCFAQADGRLDKPSREIQVISEGEGGDPVLASAVMRDPLRLGAVHKVAGIVPRSPW